MIVIQATLESFTLIERVKNLIKGKKDFYLVFNLIEPMGNKNGTIEKTVEFKQLRPGKAVKFKGKNGNEKEIFRAAMLPNTVLQVELHAVKKGGDFFRLLVTLIGAGAVAGVGLITGNVSTIVSVAMLKNFTESVFKRLASDKNDDGGDRDVIELGSAIFTREMMIASPYGKIPLTAANEVYIGAERQIDEKTGAIKIIRSYLPGGFGIAEVDMEFTVTEILKDEVIAK